MKKTKKQKKTQRKVTKRVKPQPRKKMSQELVIRVQPSLPVAPSATDLAEPMREGKKLTIPKTWVSEGQLNQILQVTPKKYVYQRPGKGGGTFDYVTTSYVTKALNYIFGWNWDFDVVEHGIEGKQVWVKGKLTVRGTQANQTIVKTQFGRNDIKYRKNSTEMLDFGNDLKGATSDALKKCASMLGIASDIYGKADYKQESGKDVKETSTPPVTSHTASTGQDQMVLKEGQVLDPDGFPTYVCEKEGDPISEQEAEFSLKMYGHRLCREHQAQAKKK